jgi:hypothetical protein
MLLARLPTTLALAGLLLAAGCCCPISGRFDQSCLPPPAAHCQPLAHPGPVRASVADDCDYLPTLMHSGRHIAKEVGDKELGGSGHPHAPRGKSPWKLPGRPLLAHRLKARGPHVHGDGTLPQQHADYISPLPRFHPVPTRPVFEAY